MRHHRVRTLTIAALFGLAACSKGGASLSGQAASGAGGAAAAPNGDGASDIDKNTTTLPTYPHLIKADMLSVPSPKGCIEYMSETGDSLSTAIAWYQARLSGATAKPLQGDYRGMDFTVNGHDHALVFVLGNTGTSITLKQSLSGKECER